MFVISLIVPFAQMSQKDLRKKSPSQGLSIFKYAVNQIAFMCPVSPFFTLSFLGPLTFLQLLQKLLN